jgi:hypothetical protein
MNIKYSHIFAMCCLAGILSACTEKSELKRTPDVREIIVIDDGYKTNDEGDLMLADDDLPAQEFLLTKEKEEELTRNGTDGSQIKVMHDGFGNKTVTRLFLKHPLISAIISKIPAKGQKQIFVYVRDGRIKPLPAKFINTIFAATGDEIAGYAGILILRNHEVFNPFEAESLQDAVEPVYESFPAKMPLQPETERTEPRFIPPTPENSRPQEISTDRKFGLVTVNTFLEEFEKRQTKTNPGVRRPSRRNASPRAKD